DLSLESRLHRTDLERRRGEEIRRVGLLDRLAAGNAGLERVGVVQTGPDGFGRGWNDVTAAEIHSQTLLYDWPNSIFSSPYRTNHSGLRLCDGCMTLSLHDFRRVC